MYEEYDGDTAETLIEYTKCCISPEDDGYLSLWSAILFDLTADKAVRLVEGLHKRK